MEWTSSIASSAYVPAQRRNKGRRRAMTAWQRSEVVRCSPINSVADPTPARRKTQVVRVMVCRNDCFTPTPAVTECMCGRNWTRRPDYGDRKVLEACNNPNDTSKGLPTYATKTRMQLLIFAQNSIKLRVQFWKVLDSFGQSHATSMHVIGTHLRGTHMSVFIHVSSLLLSCAYLVPTDTRHRPVAVDNQISETLQG